MRVVVLHDSDPRPVHTWQGTASSVTDALRRAEQTWQDRRDKEEETIVQLPHNQNREDWVHEIRREPLPRRYWDDGTLT